VKELAFRVVEPVRSELVKDKDRKGLHIYVIFDKFLKEKE